MAPSEVNSHLLKVGNTHTDRWCINLSVGSKGTAGEPGVKHRQRTRAIPAFCEVSVIPRSVHLVELCIIFSGACYAMYYYYCYGFEQTLNPNIKLHVLLLF